MKRLAEPPLNWRVIMLAAMWVGLLGGLGEGLLSLGLQAFDQLPGVTPAILWISAVLDALLFLTGGYILSLGYAWLRQRNWLASRPLLVRLLDAVPVFILSFLLYFLSSSILLFQKVHVLALFLLLAGAATETARRLSLRSARLKSFLRRSLWVLGGLTLAALVYTQALGPLGERLQTARLAQAPPGAPSVLLVVVDALRADHVSAYGYERNTTPTLDRLASEGVLFENAYSTSSWSLPGHASLFTGLYPHEHGAEWDTPDALNRNRLPMLSEALLAQGYRTGGFSANTFWVTREQGFDRGFLHFSDFFISPEDILLRTFTGRIFERFVLRPLGVDDIPGRRHAEDINTSALAWLDQSDAGAGKPFFLFLNYMDAHDPYLPPEPYRSMFSGGKPAGGLLNWRVEREDIPLSESELQSEIDAYDGGAAYADASLGALLEALEARGLADNLLVVVTSDHGEALGEHGLYLHANSLYRSVIRVPLILWRSGPALPAEVRVAQPVSNSWVGATIMDLVNPAMQSTIPGPSLASLWNNSQVDAAVFPDPLAEMRQQDWKPEHFPTQSGDIASLITADWQYIEHSHDGAALFDLNTDPLGLTDIGAQPQNQTILEQMRAALQALLSQVGSAAIQRFSLAR